jgi:cytochrome c2
MPRVLHDQPAVDTPSIDPRASDIAAYLTANAPADEPAADADPAVLARGARLFTGLGCIACHVAPAIDDSDPASKRISLKYVRTKFRPAALTAYLRKPEEHYAWTKMPSFRLSDEEAAALSTFLLSSAKDDALPPTTLAPGDAAKGKALFESVGCVNCHSVDPNGAAPHRGEVAIHDWTRGCAADDPGKIGKGVDFAFTEDQRDALRTFAKAEPSFASLSHDPLPEFADRQMTALRCNACHTIDDRDNTWSNLDDEVAKIEESLPPADTGGEGQQHAAADQSRPPLTWIGEKLRPQWMSRFIAGEIPYKPRQWLVARMPGFGEARAKLIADGLALSHGCLLNEAPEPPVDAKLADIGKGLTSRSGFGCVACHGVGDQPPLAPFEAPSINFAHIMDRMRHDFFTRWIRHPQYYLPGTKMPQFSDANGKTAYKNILGGDAAPQYEAIWQYLRAGEQITPPQ